MPSYVVQGSDLYECGESAQTAPSEGDAAVEPCHDVNGHGILDEPEINTLRRFLCRLAPTKAVPRASV